MCVTMYRGRSPDNNWTGMRREGGTDRLQVCHAIVRAVYTRQVETQGVRPDIKHQPGAQSTGLKEGRLIMIID